MEKTQINLNNLPSEEAVVEKQSRLDKISFWLIVLATLILPFVFLPSFYSPIQFGKTLILAIAALGSLILWIIARLKDGKFNLPNNLIIWGTIFVMLATVLSTLFSGSMGTSFIGQGFEVGTLASIIVFSIFLLLIPIIFKTKEKILYLYLVFFLSFFIIFVYHFLRVIFGPGMLSFGLLTDPTSNLIGKWSDLGAFFGLSAILSLVTIELISLSRFFRAVVYLALVFSLFFLAIINFGTAWIAIGVLSLIVFVYNFSRSGRENYKSSLGNGALGENGETMATKVINKKVRKVSFVSLFVLIISLIFILAGSQIDNYVSSRLNISSVDVRPNLGATTDIWKSAVSERPILGIGPNRFVNEWLIHKPDSVNSTIFWNTDFNNGSGFVPTLMVTEGILGTLAWLFFILSFLCVGFKAILQPINDKISRYLILSSFLASLFLWIINVFYMPSAVIIGLSYIFSGVFLAAILEGRIGKTKTISFSGDPKLSFVSVFVLVIVLVLSIAFGYMYTQKFISAVYFSNASKVFSVDGDANKAEQFLMKANKTYESDIFYRSLVETGLVKMNSILALDTSKNSEDSIRSQFQSVFGNTLQNAKTAVDFNKTDYQNWVSLGRLYEAVVPLKIQGAYENASSAYNQAIALNPSSPALYLTLARLEMAKGDSTKATSYITAALQKKNNYTDAIFYLSQIEASQGNITAAINSATSASTIAPDDPTIFYQLGLLKYNAKDYKGAAGALENAVSLNPSYANAKYFLGLSYANTGDKTGAIEQFTDLQITNPDNQEVAAILKNLKAGKAPFPNANPPLTAPEKRSTPPIKENKVKTTVTDPSVNQGVNSGN